MKICQISCSRGVGGLERHYIDLCNALAQRHEVVAIAHAEFRERLSPRVQLEPLDLTGWRYDPRVVVELYAALKRHRPDVVHAQANKAAIMVGLLRPFFRAGYVATVHNVKHNTRMFRGFDRVIAVSHHTARQMHWPNIDVVYNGIEPPVLAPGAGPGYLRRTLEREIERPVVMAVGRLVKAKGFDVLLRAWANVRASLVLVGDGPERPKLEAYIREHGLGGRVTLAGYQQDVPSLLAGADLMVISSRKEGFSYVLAEGLHVGVMAVATRVPVANEILPDRFLVDCDDPDQLAAAINSVLADVEGARAAFAPVWDLAARELTLARMAEKTERVYERALSAP